MMKMKRPRLLGAVTAGIALLWLAAPASGQPPVSFEPTASVMKFMDAYCMDDDGKVSGKVLNAAQVIAEKKGCLTLRTTDNKIFYVMRPPAKPATCTKRAGQGPKATVTAGSAGANECPEN